MYVSTARYKKTESVATKMHACLSKDMSHISIFLSKALSTSICLSGFSWSFCPFWFLLQSALLQWRTVSPVFPTLYSMRDNMANNLFLFESCQLLIPLGAIGLPRENLVQENASCHSLEKIWCKRMQAATLCNLLVTEYSTLAKCTSY